MTAPVPQDASAAALQQAISHHQAGRLAEAEELYRDVLKANPAQPDANHNLGVLAHQVGQTLAGLPYLKLALAIDPGHAQYVLSYGEALLACGDAEQALHVVESATRHGLDSPAVRLLREKARSAVGHESRGRDSDAPGTPATNSGRKGVAEELPPAEHERFIALFNAGRHVEIESRARLLLKRYPDSGLVWMALGAALGLQDKPALEALQKAAQLLPDNAAAQSNLGNALKDLGQLAAAVASHRRALELDPDYAEAHSNLGNALKELGLLTDAAESYRRAIALKPDFAEAHNNLGNTLSDLDQAGDAAASCRRALALRPSYPEAHNNLGNALTTLGQLAAAVASYEHALAIKADFAEAHNNLGNALKDLGQLDDAIASCRRALAIKPDYAEAHNNLGNALSLTWQLDEAIAHYRRAIETKPDFSDAYCNLGNAFSILGQLDRAATHYLQALEIKPDFAEAHGNLGKTLRGLGQLDAAVECHRRALAIRPEFAEVHSNLGNALCDLGQIDEGLASYRRALAIKPDYAEAHNNLGNAHKDLGQLDQALASYHRALECKVDYAEAYGNLIFTTNYQSTRSAAELLAEARRYGQMVARKARPYTAWSNVPDPDRCLRVGLVSGDLRNHPVGYFAENVLAALSSGYGDRLQFTVYSTHFSADELTDRLKTFCRRWHSTLGMSDESLGRRIRDDGIDILIDLSGHTGYNRLPTFAWKPAPVQVSWLGYFATTGVAAIDYLIADPWTVTPAEDAHFSEKIWRLPETYLCFTPPDADVEPAALPALSAGHITFGCFNNLTKMNDAVVALWARVLAAVPHSRLLLKAKQLQDDTMCQRVTDRFAAHGIDSGRLLLEGAVPRTQLLAAYQRVDIALDPFPYPGGTTTAEALWMGVPVLTLAGDRFLSHIGESIVHNAGLPEWIAADHDDYVARAVYHASDLAKLSHLHASLRHTVVASPLFDAPRFAGHFEAALRGMWTQWCIQQQGQR